MRCYAHSKLGTSTLPRVNTISEDTPYDGLGAEVILDAMEAVGYEPTGALLGLNSYENRVYQIPLEDGEFKVVKFYRPERWSREQIEEEHAFTFELADAELPVVAPETRDGASLFEHQGFLFAVYPRRGGHPPNIENEDDLKVLARTIARIHAVGSAGSFKYRASLDSQRMGVDSRTFLLEGQWLPPDIEEAYSTITEQLLARMPDFSSATTMRIHGDCHLGNVLWREDTPNFVDFDDTVTGPAIQDLWMLLSGEYDERQRTMATILEAYEVFMPFAYNTLQWIEPLRSLRIMHHAAWIARRWHDPAFPPAFPTFDTGRFWSDHVLDLRQQISAMDEAPIAV